VNDPTSSLREHLRAATFFFALVLIAGTSAYWTLGDGRWSVFDCFYMTLITVSTVGYGELLSGMETMREARVVSAVLLVLGSGTLLYFVSTITALLIVGRRGDTSSTSCSTSGIRASWSTLHPTRSASSSPIATRTCLM
jgi:hypothetical protein